MSFTPPTKQEALLNLGQFQSLSRILLSPGYSEHLKRPLAYWVLPTDRRLPLAFLSRSLRELLTGSYEELAKTPGIGQKKMSALVQLLARAADTDPAAMPEVGRSARPSSASCNCPSHPSRIDSENGSCLCSGFDPASVSEMLWSQWCASVMQHGMGGEQLGRFSPSLQNVTKVIWNTPLAHFAQYTLAELRAMKTYGDKRIQAIMEVFYCAHAIAAGWDSSAHLTLKIVPQCIDRIEQWVGRSLQKPGIPTKEEILDNFIRPLLQQIKIDASPQLVTLAENRLGTRGPLTSVRQSARNMGLTRARVYQLLNEINDIMTVRWPLGRHQVYELRQKFERESAEMKSPPNLDRFYAALELIFPGNRRGADGPLEIGEDAFEEETVDLLEV